MGNDQNDVIRLRAMIREMRYQTRMIEALVRRAAEAFADERTVAVAEAQELLQERNACMYQARRALTSVRRDRELAIIYMRNRRDLACLHDEIIELADNANRIYQTGRLALS